MFEKLFSLFLPYKRLTSFTARMFWPGTRVGCPQSMASWAPVVWWLHFPDFYQKNHKRKKEKNHSQWHLSVTTVNSSLFSPPTLLSPSPTSSLLPTCSILAGTKLCYGNKWLGRDVSKVGPPFLTLSPWSNLPPQMGGASITLLSGTRRSPKQSSVQSYRSYVTPYSKARISFGEPKP